MYRSGRRRAPRPPPSPQSWSSPRSRAAPPARRCRCATSCTRFSGSCGRGAGRWCLPSPCCTLCGTSSRRSGVTTSRMPRSSCASCWTRCSRSWTRRGPSGRIVIPITKRKLSKQVLKVLNTIFHGQLLSQVTCLSCKHKSNTVEPFWDLSLEFPERYHSADKGSASTAFHRSCTLTEMLSKFTEMEALEGRIYACNHCNRRRRKSSHKPLVLSEARKQLLIYRLPQVLRLHLKRFRWSGRNHREKIGVHVAFDQVLNIKPYCCTDSGHSVHRGGYVYDLSAVVMHHGKGFGSGHYTAYCFNTEGGFWVHCNDSEMRVCSVEEVCNTQAYILFYTQRSA
ncbi:Ubiquitin carboxyl-terminal hydrolase 49 [Oryzias melastigma]|uniref:ubiquitinyl hydrolase 1 n=1 Tax=Oryzias melastigma TaxID=30732 RepID=A0A834FLK3_ORYME|nr:Ubiquitin carboxyl-terminal hydrolase 49 [Oryzias melastigma]